MITVKDVPVITLLKIFKGAPDYFSIDDSAMNPHFAAHFLLLDKDSKIQINLPFFKEDRSF